MFKSFVTFLAIAQSVAVLAANITTSVAPLNASCTTFVSTSYSTHTTAYFVVNDIPAADAAKAGIYPVVDCNPFFHSPYNAFSCHNSTAIPAEDACCFENYGVLMSTQFWDYNPTYLSVAINGTASDKAAAEKQAASDALADPVKNDFTIHGLWNDLCDGSYRLNCNPPLEFNESSDNMTDIMVNQFGEGDLYHYMTKYWLNNVKSNVPDGGSISLWEHEYNKHGTCMNTLLPGCFVGPYKRFENAVNFFKKVVELYKNLPSQTFLANEGIVPSVSKKYPLKAVTDALAKYHAGSQVYVGCLNGSIDEIWYYHNLHGNVLTGDYRPIDSLTKNTCPDQVWYLPK